ncbi:MAG: DMT family transporter [Candidatus Krumholzibacteria bacterium]|nr:DMT family transporter [Candidatus Krumholzibacteria bacterium]
MGMGELYALLSAIVWAFAVILFKKSGETVPPFALNVYRASVSLVLVLVTMLAVREPLISGAPLTDYLLLFLSGIIGIAISDTLFHRSLNIVGAGITAIVDCLYSPFVVIIAFLAIGERIGPWQVAGMFLIIAGIFVAARHDPSPGTTRRQLVIGVFWGVLAMLTLAIGIVIAKPVLNRSSVLWATAMRLVGCVAVMLPVGLFTRGRRDMVHAFTPSASWKFTLSAAVVAYVALLLWIAGMKYTLAGIAAILNQSNTIYVLILASIFLGEPFSKRKLMAAAIAIAGILMVTMG